MTAIKACLFDLDGVIVDTAKYHYLAWKRLAQELGFDLTEEENERLKGISRAESLELLLQWGGVSLSPQQKQEAMARKNEWYLAYVQAMAPDEILPGAREFLNMVSKAGLKTALGSASKNASLILDKLNITNHFDVVIDGNSITRGKPDPETFLLGANQLGVEPANAVVFEDAAAGIDAALAGGFYAVGIGSPEILHKAHIVIPGLHNQDLSLFNKLETLPNP